MVGSLNLVSWQYSKCYYPAGIDLRGPGSTLQAISVLAAIVTIHELGHFIAARSQNIHVTKFSIGFGPILFKYQVHNLHAAMHLVMCLPTGYHDSTHWLPDVHMSHSLHAHCMRL